MKYKFMIVAASGLYQIVEATDFIDAIGASEYYDNEVQQVIRLHPA